MDIEKIFDQLLDDTEKISEQINSFEQVIQIIYQPSNDSIIASSLFARVFYDLQKPCILSMTDGDQLESLRKRESKLNIIIGFTTSQIQTFNISGVIIALNLIDNSSTQDDLTVISVSQYGLNSLNLNLSTLAYFICSPIAIKLDKIITLPLISFHSEFMMKEYQGIIKIVSEDAVTGEVISINKQLSFLGSGIYRVSDSLFHTLYPFLPGITGDNRKAVELLTKSGIEDEIKGKKRTLSDLSKDEIRDLNSNIIVQLALHKGYQEEELKFVKSKTTLLNEDEESIIGNVWDFAAAVNDSINRGRILTAMAVLIGNRTDFLRKLTILYDEERKGVGVSYRFIQDNQDKVIELSSLRYFVGDYKISWYTSSNTAAMALSHGLVTPDFPFAVVAPGPEDLVTIGIRASKSHNIGNLTELIQEIIDKRNINAKLTGSLLRCQLSIKSDQYENILLDLNTKIREILF